jgi:hypothetical protein
MFVPPPPFQVPPIVLAKPPAPPMSAQMFASSVELTNSTLIARPVLLMGRFSVGSEMLFPVAVS